MKLRLIISIFVLLTLFNDKIHTQNFWEEIFTTGPSIFSMDISDDGIIYLGTADGIWKSFDNGDTWAFDTIWVGHSVYSLETKSDGVVYAGCSYKIYYSSDYGSNWIKIYDGVVISNVTSICSADSIILAGTWDGILKSTDNGENWQHVLQLGGSESIQSVIQYQPNIFFAGSVPHLSSDIGGLFISEDFGETWTSIPNTYHYGVHDITINQSGNLISAVIWDPGWIFGGVFEYNLVLNTWQSLKYGERGVAIVVNDFNHYYAGIDNELGNGGCRASYDGGETWESINSGLTCSHIQNLDITPDGYLFATSKYPSKVFRSIGSTYTGIDKDLGEVKIYQIFPNPTTEKINIQPPNSYCKGIIEVRKLEGSLVKRMNIIEENNTMNIKELKSGIYLYSIIQDGEIVQQGKLIKN